MAFCSSPMIWGWWPKPPTSGRRCTRGQKVEEGRVEDVFRSPRHPYTVGLLAAARYDRDRGRSLREIPGSVPSPFEVPTGCRFAPRCSRVIDRCCVAPPPLEVFAPGHAAACIRAETSLA